MPCLPLAAADAGNLYNRRDRNAVSHYNKGSPGLRPAGRNRGKTRGSSRLVMAGLVPAIPIIWRCAILIEIAGTSPAMTP